ncbi:hypothetical protein PR202_ga12616 [Eleusine coracana subsp. coracana]|uniref:DNA (cytosine-5-)-methyltransferase n=1 Tax=Eleusine coracana subsp. coracana TaxID=191504 RepID=A0AAV5CCP6_ELECO|nr:hypothetical protein PR202_ga12616 [Eleusine coracana subsp. coracana]
MATQLPQCHGYDYGVACHHQYWERRRGYPSCHSKGVKAPKQQRQWWCSGCLWHFDLLESKESVAWAMSLTMRVTPTKKKKKERLVEENVRKRKRFGDEAQGSRVPLDVSHDEPMTLPNPMVGFNLPIEGFRSGVRWSTLPTQAIGPPYFYYENVALAPKGVWTTILRFLYDIKPEFVDSGFFCAAARKRGYIHNLPVKNRSSLNPLPPKTICEAFPRTKKWWPSWDPRKKLNCIQTSVASSTKLIESIRLALTNNADPPPPTVQNFVLKECRKYNLLWVGRNKVAHLEPNEIELLGFPPDHTRGITRKERYRSLGNSFQVDTVAYHLSVLKELFPHGINVLSLFSGIGGAEVALHKLGIRMKTVLSIEKSKVNRTVLRNWWDEHESGLLIEIDNIKNLTSERIESYVKKFGGFDLVIGGSPCNNIAGSNRYHQWRSHRGCWGCYSTPYGLIQTLEEASVQHPFISYAGSAPGYHRDGLNGEHSYLFYHYVRVLETVKSAMRRL